MAVRFEVKRHDDGKEVVEFHLKGEDDGSVTLVAEDDSDTWEILNLSPGMPAKLKGYAFAEGLDVDEDGYLNVVKGDNK